MPRRPRPCHWWANARHAGRGDGAGSRTPPWADPRPRPPPPRGAGGHRVTRRPRRGRLRRAPATACRSLPTRGRPVGRGVKWRDRGGEGRRDTCSGWRPGGGGQCTRRGGGGGAAGGGAPELWNAAHAARLAAGPPTVGEQAGGSGDTAPAARGERDGLAFPLPLEILALSPPPLSLSPYLVFGARAVAAVSLCSMSLPPGAQPHVAERPAATAPPPQHGSRPCRRPLSTRAPAACQRPAAWRGGRPPRAPRPTGRGALSRAVLGAHAGGHARGVGRGAAAHSRADPAGGGPLPPPAAAAPPPAWIDGRWGERPGGRWRAGAGTAGRVDSAAVTTALSRRLRVRLPTPCVCAAACGRAGRGGHRPAAAAAVAVA